MDVAGFPSWSLILVFSVQACELLKTKNFQGMFSSEPCYQLARTCLASPKPPLCHTYKGSKCNGQSDVLFFTSKFEDTVTLTFQQKVRMKLNHLGHQKYQVDSFSSLSNLRSANLLGPIAPISIMRLSASWCHFRQWRLEIGSASAERAG